jgi:hypothetical protein
MNTITHTQPTHHNGSNGTAAGGDASADLAKLVVRIASPGDRDSIDELAARAGGSQRPSGALMLAAVDGRLLAASSMARRESVSDPTPSGWAASAVVEYTLAGLERRRRMPRRAA